MFFSRKKSSDEQISSNSALIEGNASQIVFLAKLCENEKLRLKLNEAQIRLNYLSPTANLSANTIDRKIECKLGDIKIALSKAKQTDNYIYAEELIENLFLLITERKAIAV